MERIMSPEMLWGLRSTSRKIVTSIYELVTIRFPSRIDLAALASKIPEAEYDPELSNLLKLKTHFGCIQVYAGHLQIQHCTDPNKIPVLCTFIAEALEAKGTFSFDAFMRSLDYKDLGILEDFKDDVRQVRDDLLKPIKRIRK